MFFFLFFFLFIVPIGWFGRERRLVDDDDQRSKNAIFEQIDDIIKEEIASGTKMNYTD